MTQFRLYDSPQSFVYDSPQSFLHGVTEPQQECYIAIYGSGSQIGTTFQYWVPNSSVSNCPGTPPPGTVKEIRDGNYFNTTTNPGGAEDFLTIRRVSCSWQTNIAAVGGTPFKPDAIRLGNIIGVESGVTRTLFNMPRNARQGEAGCWIYDATPISLVGTDANIYSFQRAQSMTYSVHQFDSGDFVIGDVESIFYDEYFYILQGDPAPGFGVNVDWEASGYFLPGEECYFEGCPAPIIQSVTCTTFNPNASGVVVWNGNQPCANFIPTSAVPNPVPEDTTVVIGGNTAFRLTRRVHILIQIVLTKNQFLATPEELAQINKVWTGDQSGATIDLSNLGLTNGTSTCGKTIDYGGQPGCGDAARFRQIEFRQMASNGFTQINVTSLWGNLDTAGSNSCGDPLTAPFPVFIQGETLS